MLFDNLRRTFKKPDEKKQEEQKTQIDKEDLEKNDLPAMILSAYMVFIPAALLVLGVIALVAFLFIN